MGSKTSTKKPGASKDPLIREDLTDPHTGRELKMTRKQIRARMRRQAKALEAEEAALTKPIKEWDLEELARGRPKNKNGTFSGPAPRLLTRAVHEQITREFAIRSKDGLKLHAVKALEVLNDILENDDTTEDGKLVIPASVKVDVAKFVLEHIMGKPTQKIEQDISVRLQGILAAATGSPAANIISSTVIEAQTGLKPSKTHKAIVAQVPGRLTSSDMDDDEEDSDLDDERDVG